MSDLIFADYVRCSPIRVVVGERGRSRHARTGCQGARCEELRARQRTGRRPRLALKMGTDQGEALSAPFQLNSLFLERYT